MGETIYVKHRRKGNSGLVLHLDPDCPRITGVDTYERDRALYPEDTPVCKWCSEEYDPTTAGGPNTLANRLKAMAPDES